MTISLRMILRSKIKVASEGGREREKEGGREGGKERGKKRERTGERERGSKDRMTEL